MAIEDKLPLRKSKFIVSYFIRTFLVINTVIVALTVPFFGYVMTFTDVLLGVTVSILLPCLCYLKIKKPLYLEIMFIGVTKERFGHNLDGSKWTESMGRCSSIS
ncbi:hypothetical protein H5410_029509 [Solanum commersonii]|uniref:Amino acid transporter transmembrane domain-containing protein n=1 Tax=Solanum commersonii TaxID=4109 RepID=A0A9J5Z561_SOLCO|nr:hypothetical protein H5410_029509 [Solanum commersonii]